MNRLVRLRIAKVVESVVAVVRVEVAEKKELTVCYCYYSSSSNRSRMSNAG